MDKRTFYTDQKGHYYVVMSEGLLNKTCELCYTLKDLYQDVDDVVMTKDEMDEAGFVECSQTDIYLPCGTDCEKKEKVVAKIGIGYICPFCGGYLRWENDFMKSEIGLWGGENSCYVEVENEELLNDLIENEDQMIQSCLMSTTDDIETDNEQIAVSGDYNTTYKKETKDGETKYYQINDTVVGLYTCMNCGKNYEISDCLPSEQKDYPYFQ